MFNSICKCEKYVNCIYYIYIYILNSNKKLDFWFVNNFKNFFFIILCNIKYKFVCGNVYNNMLL